MPGRKRQISSSEDEDEPAPSQRTGGASQKRAADVLDDDVSPYRRHRAGLIVVDEREVRDGRDEVYFMARSQQTSDEESGHRCW